MIGRRHGADEEVSTIVAVNWRQSEWSRLNDCVHTVRLR